MKFDELKKEFMDNFEKTMVRLATAERLGVPALIEEIVAVPGLNDKIRLAIDSYSLDIHFAGTKHDLEAVWRLMRQHGWQTAAKRPKRKDPGWSGFWRKDEEVFICYMSYTSTLCKRVKVGTQTVEQDIYETVCGEQEPTEDVCAECGKNPCECEEEEDNDED